MLIFIIIITILILVIPALVFIAAPKDALKEEENAVNVDDDYIQD